MSRPAFNPQVPVTLSFDCEILSLRAERGGAPVSLDSSSDREALLAEVRAGTFTGKLHVDAITYIQVDGKRNRNFTRFKASKLGKIAKSGRGSVFLADHAQRQLSARGGTVVASELVEHKGAQAFRQTFELVKPWAIEGILDGTIDRFSIGWYPTGPIHCTACRADWLECAHWPGDEVTLDGETVIVEFEFQDAELVETSGVNVPAVLGTRIEGIRAALTAALNDGAERPRERNVMLSKLIGILALAATATEDEVLERVKRAAAADTLLAGEREAHDNTKKALATANEEIGELRKQNLAAESDAILAAGVAAGKIPVRHEMRDGKLVRVEGDLEKAVRETCRLMGAAAAREYVSRLPVVGPPASAGAVNVGADPTPRAAETLNFGEHGRKQIALLGTSEDDVRKYGAPR